MKQNKKLKLEKNNLLIIGLSIFVLILMLFLITTLFSFDEYKKFQKISLIICKWILIIY